MPVASISTHVLDATGGRPAPGIRVLLSRADEPVAEAVTDESGRIADLAGEVPAGRYRLSFEVGAYFAEAAHLFHALHVDVDVGGGHHHLPLLLAPYSCTTYRGR